MYIVHRSPSNIRGEEYLRVLPSPERQQEAKNADSMLVARTDT